ncbi:MAG: HNH endonuclease family protein [Micromonosporaceae bacterium]
MRQPRHRLLAGASALLVAVGLSAVAGCDVTVNLASNNTTKVPDPPSVGKTHDQLAGLRVAEPASMAGYSRERFPHWSSHDDNCDTRELVLKRDGKDVSVGDDCYPTSGRWRSAYDNEWVAEPSDVDIDHMVPLANAWRSGAHSWSDSQRETFANDLERGQLIAVTAGSNRSKGDQDPSQWRPDNSDLWCLYAQWWIDVKHHYRLAITRSEKSALDEMLTDC